ncbi:MAG: hypothetical protein LAO21_15365 [Acidobacteriia bacterium]|nr:hypothetical protein [Terriglobia bacterium]
MKNRSWLLRVGWLGLVLALTPLNSSTAQEPPALKTPAVPPASDSRFFKLKDLRPGMMGVGHTVFKGDAVSDFQVEILGVVDNFLPKQSAIFARLSGGPLAETGVFAGMSGSPVFVDGKLLGAVAYSFPFSKEAIAAITPIENMVNMTDSSPLRPDKGTAGTSSYAEGPSDGSSQSITQQLWGLVPSSPVNIPVGEWAGRTTENGLPNPAELKPIDTPLMLSGFPRAAIDYFLPQFRAMGLAPVMGGAMGGPDVPNDTLAEASDIGPGSGVGAQLVRGIFGATAAGKVTYREGNRIFAFGHPFLHSGPTDLPMTKTRLITVLPSLMNSTELSVPTELIGTIKEDRVSGIFGEVGVAPRMIPVTIHLRSSRNIQKTFRFETVNDRFLTPFLVNFTVFSALTSSERALGESTLEVQGTIALKGKQEVRVESFVSGDANSSVIASLSVANPVNFLLQSGLKDVQIDSITVDVTSWDEKRQAVLERIWSDRREVEAGDRAEVSAVLRRTDGEEILVRIPITIPEQTPPGPLMVTVMDGGVLSMLESRETRPTYLPKDLSQLVRIINQARQNNRLYVRVMRPEQSFAIYGEAFPAVPPSLAALMLSDRTSGANQTTLRSSPLATVEGPPLNLLLAGQRSITLSVVK